MNCIRCPVNTRSLPTVCLMLGQRRRRWLNIKQQWSSVARSLVCEVTIYSNYFAQYEMIKPPFPINKCTYYDEIDLVNFMLSFNIRLNDKQYHYVPVNVKQTVSYYFSSPHTGIHYYFLFVYT